MFSIKEFFRKLKQVSKHKLHGMLGFDPLCLFGFIYISKFLVFKVKWVKEIRRKGLKSHKL